MTNNAEHTYGNEMPNFTFQNQEEPSNDSNKQAESNRKPALQFSYQSTDLNQRPLNNDFYDDMREDKKEEERDLTDEEVKALTKEERVKIGVRKLNMKTNMFLANL